MQALGCSTILGNYDEGVGFERESCGCNYIKPFDIQMSDISFFWTRQHTSDEHKAWLRELPRQLRVKVGGLDLLLCHGSPSSTTEYLGAKVLAFRFGTPYMVWARQGADCAIIRLAMPVTLVSPLPRDAVTKLLHKKHCIIPSWNYLHIVHN